MATATAILDRELFVQAFWVKCREVIRPELDRAVERLRHREIEAEIASQEYDATADQPGPGRGKESGPSLTLTAGAGPADSRPRLLFYGDVLLQRVLVFAGRRKTATSYALDQLDAAETLAIVTAWEAKPKTASSIGARPPPAGRRPP